VSSPGKPTALILGGGPDAEREVSLKSAALVAAAVRAGGGFDVVEKTIGAVTLADLRAMPGGVIWPVLHGPFGEGGPMQDLLEADGRPYVGCGPSAARLAMDKVATKMIAARSGILTAEACVLNPRDAACPLPLPVVVKPIFEGSTIGLHVCRTAEHWRAAHEDAARSARPCMIERFVPGREITVGLLEREPGRLSVLPTIEIIPAEGLYDYEAKYTRNDTRYVVNPPLAPAVLEEASRGAERLASALGVRGLARADFIIADADGRPRLLEINTMPGMTDHSLVPMAAAAAGLDMPRLCTLILERALRGAETPR
jgi:D-alanine-D-alanine ligase